jgi:threonine dehydrogenase-like Zn-dependent dehydrogenase
VQTSEADTVFVLGCGSIGLLTIASLRASGCRSRIIAAAKHDHQREHAIALGADEVVGHSRDVGRRYDAWAKVLNADVYRPEIGKPTVIGGARAVFDCVATSESLDDSLRFTDAGGDMVVVGMPSIPQNVEWTTLWFKELRVHAAYAYGDEEIEGPGGAETVETFDYAIRLLTETKLPIGEIVGEPFALGDYRSALKTALCTGATRSVKTVFRID